MHKFLHFNNLLNYGSKNLKRKYQSRTVAAEPFAHTQVINTAESFLRKTQEDEVYACLGVGVTFLSFKDRYNRKTGREEALKKLKMEKLKVVGVEVTPTHVFVRLEPFQGVKLSLRTSKVSGFSTVTGELVGE